MSEGRRHNSRARPLDAWLVFAADNDGPDHADDSMPKPALMASLNSS